MNWCAALHLCTASGWRNRPDKGIGNMSKPRLRVALIGQGFMGRAHSNAYCQAPHFFDLPWEIERRVICGRNRESLQTMAATWGWSEVATDWRAVVERPDIDLVDVAV